MWELRDDLGELSGILFLPEDQWILAAEVGNAGDAVWTERHDEPPGTPSRADRIQGMTILPSLRGLPRHLVGGAGLAGILLLAGCGGIEEVVRDHFRGETPHEQYLHALEDAGLAESALARRWRHMSEASFAFPVDAALPLEEHGRFDASEPTALSWLVPLRRGERLEVMLSLADDDDAPAGEEEPGFLEAEADPASPGESRDAVFIELYRLRDPEGDSDGGRPLLVASPDPRERHLVHDARVSGLYLLRIQPELFVEGEFSLRVRTGASLAFPVEGRDTGAIRSVFGDARDGGARDHHGVDIFAPRGTPVLAASPATVTRVRETPIGGKVVWTRDDELGISQYYAHLDSQAVTAGASVRPGDTLGFVGNTGNAVTTPPHLHFGIYVRGAGAVDPWPYLYEAATAPVAVSVDPEGFRTRARLRSAQTAIRRAPAASAPPLPEGGAVGSEAAVLILGGAGDWYRVRTPEGMHGYVRSADLARLPTEEDAA